MFHFGRKQLVAIGYNGVLGIRVRVLCRTLRKGGTMPREKSIKRSINFAPDTLKTLDTLAVKNNTTTSELVREYVEKGLSVDGYKQDVDFITSIIRNELMAIYNIDDIKAVVEHQIERAIKMQMKTGKVSASAFFLLIHTVTCMWPNTTRDDIANLLERSTKHGVGYMQKKDYQINDFLYDTDSLFDEAEKVVNDK